MRTLGTQFKYKADRDYVHGTDIYNLVENNLSELMPSTVKFNLNFLKRTIGNADFFLGTKEDFFNFSNKDAITFRGSASGEGVEYFFWGVENGKQITEKYPYDEKIIEGQCVYSEGEVEFNLINSNLSPIEIFIPMFKYLLANKCPDYKGKWMFTRLDLSDFLRALSKEVIKMRIYQYSNPKLVCADIFNQENKIGRIFFSLT